MINYSTSLPHHQEKEWCQLGRCWFPQKEALQCFQDHQRGSPLGRMTESPKLGNTTYCVKSVTKNTISRDNILCTVGRNGAESVAWTPHLAPCSTWSANVDISRSFRPDLGWNAPQQQGSSHWCCPRHERGSHAGLAPIQQSFRGSLHGLPGLQLGLATGNGIILQNCRSPPVQCTEFQTHRCLTPV